MTLLERSLAMLGVQRGEARLVGRMLVLYLVLIGALVLIQSMAFGLFIAEFGSKRLPHAYLVIAGLATLVSFGMLYRKSGRGSCAVRRSRYSSRSDWE